MPEFLRPLDWTKDCCFSRNFDKTKRRKPNWARTEGAILVSKPRSLIKRMSQSTLVIGVASLLWLIYKSGTKPSRIVYPCQRAAAANCYTFLLYPTFAFLVHFSKTTVPRAYNKVSHSRRGHLIILTSLVSLSVMTSGLAIYNNTVFDPWSALASRVTLTQKVTEVSVVKVENNELEQSLQTAIDYIGGISSIIPEGAKVLIKPNIVRYQAPPDTTDPAIVEALINIIKQRNPSVIWVAEGSGEGNTIQNFMALGYSSIANIPGVELVDLNYGDLVEVPVPGGGYVFDSFMFNSKVMEADVFISLPCMKTHNTAVVTLGMKNLVGISAGSVYGVAGTANHWHLHEVAQQKGDTNLGGVIADLNSARKINLTIIDGRVAMEGEGPHDGEPVNLGLLIVGKDPVATDTVASTIMGFDAEKVPSLVFAAQKGLGTNDLHEIEVKGETIHEVFYPFAAAQGHGSFLVISGAQLLLYRWKALLFLPAIIFVSITVLAFYMFRRSEIEPMPTTSVSRTSGQATLSDTKPAPPPEEKKAALLSEVPSKRLEDEINDDTALFQRYVKQIEEASMRLEEVTKLLKNGEIPQNAYEIIAGDLSKQLSMSVETLFDLRENLELIRSKAMIEKAKSKETQNKALTTQKSPPTPVAEDLRFVRGYRDIVESQLWTETGPGQRVYSPSLGKWEELILKIDLALSSLPTDKELRIIEQYSLFAKESSTFAANSEQTEKSISVCKQRLATVSEKWVSIRRGKIEQMVNLEADAASVRDQIKELETRFSVGEISQPKYEYENNKLQNNLKKLEKEISEIRSLLDDMDMVIFRSTELLRDSS